MNMKISFILGGGGGGGDRCKGAEFVSELEAAKTYLLQCKRRKENFCVVVQAHRDKAN